MGSKFYQILILVIAFSFATKILISENDLWLKAASFLIVAIIFAVQGAKEITVKQSRLVTLSCCIVLGLLIGFGQLSLS